jgi:hypothetical protein
MLTTVDRFAVKFGKWLTVEPVGIAVDSRVRPMVRALFDDHHVDAGHLGDFGEEGITDARFGIWFAGQGEGQRRSPHGPFSSLGAGHPSYFTQHRSGPSCSQASHIGSLRHPT